MKQDKIKQSCFEKSHDVIVSILGNVVAIGVTTDPKVCQHKKTKPKQLRPLLDQLGIDSVGVFCADESWDIWDRIKAIAKSSEVARADPSRLSA